MSSQSRSPSSLAVVRIPTPRGPIVRCQGSLTASNVESLRRDLSLLISVGPPSLIVNVSAVRQLDSDGALALREATEQMARTGGQLVVVDARPAVEHYPNPLKEDGDLTVCCSEEAALALIASPHVGTR